MKRNELVGKVFRQFEETDLWHDDSTIKTNKQRKTKTKNRNDGLEFDNHFMALLEIH